MESNENFDRRNLATMEAAIVKIRAAGARVVQPVKLVTLEEKMVDGGEDIDELMGKLTESITYRSRKSRQLN